MQEGAGHSTSARRVFVDDDFATTRWSLVAAAAAGEEDGPVARAALEALCQAYWSPLHAYVRRRVSNEHEARDLTQGFFARLLERRDFGSARRDRGRMRAYLLTALKHYLANEWDKQRAQKRGGGVQPLSLDFESGSVSKLPGVEGAETPDQAFERQWVASLLGLVLDRLRNEAVAQGKQQQFDVLKSSLTGSAERGELSQAAQTLGLSEGATRMAASRLRERYRQLLREEIARTLCEPADSAAVDEEIAGLFASVRPLPKIL